MAYYTDRALPGGHVWRRLKKYLGSPIQILEIFLWYPNIYLVSASDHRPTPLNTLYIIAHNILHRSLIPVKYSPGCVFVCHRNI